MNPTTTVSACNGLPTCSKCGDILPMFDKHECNPTPTHPPTEQPRECNCIDCRVGRDLGLKPNYPTDPTVDSIGEFIRDVTQVIPRPKSEVRRRLNAILSHSVQEAKAERDREWMMGMYKMFGNSKGGRVGMAILSTLTTKEEV